jgi:hypothetical protein
MFHPSKGTFSATVSVKVEAERETFPTPAFEFCPEGGDKN